MDRIDPPAKNKSARSSDPKSARTTARRLTAAGFSLLAPPAVRPHRVQTRPFVWSGMCQLWSYAVPAPGAARGRGARGRDRPRLPFAPAVSEERGAAKLQRVPPAADMA